MAIKFNKKTAVTETAAPVTATKAAKTVPADTTVHPQMKSKSVTVGLTDEQTVAITNFVRGQRDIDEFSAVAKNNELVKKSLAAFAAESAPNDEPVTYACAAGSMSFDKASDVRVVTDIKGLLKSLKDKIGYESTLKLMKFSMTDLDQYLGQAEVEKFVEHKPGTRKITGYTCNEV